MNKLILKFTAAFVSLALSGNLAWATDAAIPAKSARPCPQARGSDLVFPKKAKLEILSYEGATKTYTAVGTRLPDEGDFTVTLQALSESIRKIKKDYDSISHNPSSIVGNTYVTQESLPSLTDAEIAARKGCGR